MAYVYHIAELSGNHNQSFDHAIELIDTFSMAGASAIKLQTFTADTITMKSNRVEFKIRGSVWNGRTLYSLYKESAMPWEWQVELSKYIKNKGVDFISSPFDYSAVDFLMDNGVDALKVASPEIIDIPLIKYMATTGKPLIISTGMASMTEISRAVDAAQSGKTTSVTLLKCTSAYPAPLDDMNLGAIKKMRNAFGLEVGLSDHSLGFVAPLTAVAIGAKTIEKHVVMSRNNGGIDAAFSCEPKEYRELIELTNNVIKTLGDKVGPVDTEMPARNHRRSLYVTKNVKRGEKFSPLNIKSIRPGGGMSPDQYPVVIGSLANRDVKRGEPLLWDMLLLGESNEK